MADVNISAGGLPTSLGHEVLHRDSHNVVEWETEVIGAGNTLVRSVLPVFGGLVGDIRLLITGNNNPTYVEEIIAGPTGNFFSCRFYFALTTFTLGDGDGVFLAVFRNVTHASLNITAKRVGSQYVVQLKYKDDENGVGGSHMHNISLNTHHYLDILMTRATSDSASDAFVESAIDGAMLTKSVLYDMYDDFPLLTTMQLGVAANTGLNSGIIDVGKFVCRDDYRRIGAQDPTHIVKIHQPIGEKEYTGTVLEAGNTLDYDTSQLLGGYAGDSRIIIVNNGNTYRSRDVTAITENDWVARVYYKDLVGLSMSDGDKFDIFLGQTAAKTTHFVRYQQVSGVRSFVLFIEDDGGGFPSATSGALPAFDYIQLHARKASTNSASDGFFKLYLDQSPTPAVEVLGVDLFDDWGNNQFLLGYVPNAGTPTGTFYFGKFDVKLQDTLIGGVDFGEETGLMNVNMVAPADPPRVLITAGGIIDP